MARKTNKTAHVLNLLSGSGAQKPAKAESAAESASEEKTAGKNTPVVSGVKMDTKDSEDAVSDLIHQQLLSAFMDENALKPEQDIVTEETVQAADPEAESVSLTMPAQNSIEATASQAVPEQTDSEASAPAASEEKMSDTKPEAVQKEEPELKEEPEPEKEPEFVVLNVIERIVRDKIIYFMRQFDVCTCDRCVADTVSLTLNGLKPKYIVTPPAAVSPLLSFYTTKYISDITVEATKACMTVKENPRHKKTDETL